MQVDDFDLTDQSLEQFLSDPKKRTKLIRIMLQTLHSLGYRESAAQLEEESEVSYFSPTVMAIRNHLQRMQYLEAISLIHSLDLDDSLKTLLIDRAYHLEFCKLIKAGDTSSALELLSAVDLSAGQRDTLCQELVLQKSSKNAQQLAKQHQQMVEMCIEDSLSPKIMDGIVQEYLKLQNQSETNGKCTLAPPMRLLSISQSFTAIDISFLKFSRNGKQLLSIVETDQQVEITLWRVQQNSLQKIKQQTKLARGHIQCVSWSHLQPDPIIAICSDHTVSIFDSQLVLLTEVFVDAQRLLTVEWHPISNLLYVGGVFNSLRVYMSDGQLYMTIQPFAKLRQILFSFETLFAISATNSELLKYSLIDEKITGNFTAKLPFMSLALNESHSRLLTINNEFVYLLDVSLSILAKMYTPSNPNHYCIVGMFFESWSVLLCEGFVAYADTGKTMVWNGKGVYDIQGQYMASGKRELLLWTQGNAKDGLELNTTEFDISLRDSDREQLSADKSEEDRDSFMEIDQNESEPEMLEEIEEEYQPEDLSDS